MICNLPELSNQLDKLHTLVRGCQNCRLCESRNLAVPGEGSVTADIMFVGEAPGHVNDQVGRPFVGHGGKIFDSILNDVGLLREKVFITNAVKCWPPDNRKPKTDELAACKKYLDEQIDLVRPQIIFALGATAFSLLTGESIKLKEEHGKIVYRNTIPVCALFHPNGIRYIRGGRATIAQGIRSALDTSKLRKSEPSTQQVYVQASLFG
jgi:uracil-DNA glycosylase